MDLRMLSQLCLDGDHEHECAQCECSCHIKDHESVDLVIDIGGFSGNYRNGQLRIRFPMLDYAQEAMADISMRIEKARKDAPAPEIPAQIMERVVAHLKAGRKISAIKELRVATSMGLREAKDYVETLERQ